MNSLSDGILYLVATPIGNLKDITFRAVEVLRSVDLILCEDTRKAKILLNTWEIQKPVESFFEGNERKKSPLVAQRMKQGQNIALISEAGTPNISDPGFRLVEHCHREKLTVRGIPGPCAVVTALCISGLPTNAFIFEGFLSPKPGSRKRMMKKWLKEERTVVFYESPHRVIRCLQDLREVLGDVSIVILREMTKRFEESLEGRIEKILEHESLKRPRGEFVILFNLKYAKKKDQRNLDGI